MSLMLAGMAFSAFTQYQGIQSQKRAEQARANSLERQTALHNSVTMKNLLCLQAAAETIGQSPLLQRAQEIKAWMPCNAHQLGLLVSRLNLPCKVTMPAWIELMHLLMRAINLSV